MDRELCIDIVTHLMVEALFIYGLVRLLLPLQGFRMLCFYSTIPIVSGFGTRDRYKFGLHHGTDTTSFLMCVARQN